LQALQVSCEEPRVSPVPRQTAQPATGARNARTPRPPHTWQVRRRDVPVPRQNAHVTSTRAAVLAVLLF